MSVTPRGGGQMISDLPEWIRPPVNAIGVPSAIRVVFAAKPTVGVWLDKFVSYQNGFRFTLHVSMNEREGVRISPGPQDDRSLPRPTLSIECSDGRRAQSGVFLTGARPPKEAPELVLQPNGGSFSPSHSEEDFWLWPLPPPPSVWFSFEWNEYELSVRREVKTRDLLPESEEVRTLWK